MSLVPDVTLVFTNPRHHLEMMGPVARVLSARGLVVQLVSLAELRGFETPTNHELPIRAVVPRALGRTRRVGATLPGTGERTPLRRFAQRMVAAVLVPLLNRLIGRSRVVVIPNDSAFPYDQLLDSLDRPSTVLMQEGIRFDMPNGDRYGLGGTTAICAWGQGSREFFVSRGVSPSRVAVTGSPRHDVLDPGQWAERGRELSIRLGLANRPLVLLSNPIEHQGYGSEADRLALFERLLAEAEPVLRAQGRALIVKNHAYEDPEAFARIASRSSARDLVHVDRGPLFAALAVAAGAVVLTSTAGIEALMFGVPLAALELPGGGFGFEYVERGAAVGLRRGAIEAGLHELFCGAGDRQAAANQLIARHLHDRGHATRHVADVIERAIAG